MERHRRTSPIAPLVELILWWEGFSQDRGGRKGGTSRHHSVPAGCGLKPVQQIGNSGVEVEQERKGGNSEKNHEICGA